MNRRELNYEMALEGLRDVIPQLKENEVAKVMAHYSGSGDEGCVEEIEFLGNDNNAVPCEMGDTVHHKIKIAATMILAEEFPGWELDGGGDGTINLDVQRGKISIEHAQHFISTAYDSKDSQL